MHIKKFVVSAVSLSFALVLFYPLFSLISKESTINFSRAEELYIQHCSKCHRKSGKGIKRVYPPLESSDYIRNNTTEELLRGMIYGRSGVLVVNGVSYNGVMTTEIDNSLTNDDIALILSYVYLKLNDINKIVTAKEVESAKKAGKLPVKK